jgi:decaprenylphospho-beta-D-erythro-pentofuranosid-2-ulose 2-reductase
MPLLLVLGATSDMARATALEFCRNGWDLVLAARDVDATKAVSRDLALRSGRDSDAFDVFAFDALATETHGAFWNSLPRCPDGVLCAIGGGGDPSLAQHDLPLADQILRVNFTGLVPVLLLAANAFEARGSGVIIGIGSVAGDRGRAANYIYGSAKAGLATFFAGLHNRLAMKGVSVIFVKSGPAFTKMSAGLSLNPLLTARTEEIGRAIHSAYKKKRHLIYVKPIWRYIMLIIMHIPDFIFKRMNLAVKKQD